MVDDELIDLDGLEVPQRLLDSAGGPLPSTWAGLPLQIEVGSELLSGEAAVSDRGWRQLAGTGGGFENDPKWGTVIAAPSGDGTGGPLAWDADDRLDVVGWVQHAATGESLPFDRWQAFSGTVDKLPVEATSIDLQVRWLTHGVERLPSGDYRVTASIASLNVETEPCRLSLRSA